jgi:hypothetical protein
MLQPLKIHPLYPHFSLETSLAPHDEGVELLASANSALFFLPPPFEETFCVESVSTVELQIGAVP